MDVQPNGPPSTVDVTPNREQQEVFARIILGDLKRRETRLSQASGYFGCGAIYMILTLTIIALCSWRPDGWIVGAVVLFVIGVAVQIELRGVNKRIDALVELQIQSEDDMKKVLKDIPLKHSLPPSQNSQSPDRGPGNL